MATQKKLAVFAERCHPTFNNRPGYPWIRIGENRPIKTRDERKRLDQLGACAPAKWEALVREHPTRDGPAIHDLLVALRRRYTGKPHHVVPDNVRYYRGKRIVEYVHLHAIELVLLPQYSPRMNSIERFWRLLLEKVLTNDDYETFDESRQAIPCFLRQKSKRSKGIRGSNIPEKFNVLPLLSG